MSKSLVQIEGFDKLERKIKSLSNDKVKRKEVLKILGQVANSTVSVARAEAPKSKKPHSISGKNRATRVFQPGNLKKSIGKRVMRRARNPMLVVRARSTKKYDGFYGRQFVIKGTKKQKANPFMARAYQKTKGGVTRESEQKMARYIQKQIDRLGL